MQGYDYIIIGSGSSGGMLAYRLSENPDCKILLLEAGVSDNHWTTKIPAGNRYTFDGGPRTWSFETEPEPNMFGRRLMQPRGKVLGGSSSLNGMVFVRGHRSTYDAWAENGCEGWGYDDVLPAFKSMETCARGANKFRGDSGPIHIQRYTGNHPIEDAFVEAGIQAGHKAPDDYNADQQVGITAFDANIRNGVRSGTGRECVAVAAKRPNVTLLTQAHVTGIAIEKGRAKGVTYRHRDQDHTANTDGEVLLCAGAFQSPQLLMLSGIGPAAQLKQHGIKVHADLPGVGENLMDHLEVHLKYQSPHKGISKNSLLKTQNILKAGIQWYLTHDGPAASGPSRVGAFFKSTTRKKLADIQFHFWPYFAPGWLPDPSMDGYSFDVGPVQSESRGWVRLKSNDPYDSPRILLNGLSRDADFKEFRKAIEIAKDIEAQKAFDFCRGPLVAPGPDVKTEAEMDDYVRANAGSAYHPCGTCKMGVDEMAVVDPQARVHGVQGLRVVDASIIPSITNGNINAPALMIGEKVAGMMMAG